MRGISHVKISHGAVYTATDVTLVNISHGAGGVSGTADTLQ